MRQQDNLLTNQEFFNIYKEKGFTCAQIVLDWEEAKHTYEEWEELLLNTYLDLEQDLSKLNEVELIKHNRDTYINKINKKEVE